MKPSARRLRQIPARIVLALFGMLTSAMFWLILFGLGGAAMFAVGLWLLYGLPWSLMGGAGCSFLFAFLILRGVNSG